MKQILSAILFADAVGYSAYMRRDEMLAIQSIRHHLNEIYVLVEQHGGVRRGGAGDSVLATFPSAGAAVKCATRIQSRNKTPVDLIDMQFRIGIHLGDATEVDGQLHGDSVNIAARLEPLAGPGGVCVSRTVYEALRGNSALKFASIGSPQLKNMGGSVEIFRLEGFGTLPSSVGLSAPIDEQANEPKSEIPAVAVLPFPSVSVREDLAALAGGFAEEVIGFLTRFRGLDVIAPGSSVLSRVPDPKVLPERLNVRYLVSGSVQLAERRMRVKVQLYDTGRGRAIWSESYDQVFDDIFDIQEEIAECVAASMAVHIEETERMLARARNPESLDAYALQLRARDEIFQNEPDSCHRGMEMAMRALEISPDYARSHALLSRAHHLNWKYSWSKSPSQSFHDAHDAALQAIEIDRSDAKGLAQLGSIALYRREHERSLAAFSRALQLNPSDADIIGEYADALKHDGRKEEAISLLKRAIRLNPLNADWYLRDLAHAYLVNRDYQAAVDSVLSMTDPTQALRALTASYAYLGKMEEAHHWAELLQTKYPGFSARGWADIVPDRNPADTEHFVEGLERAGL